MDELFVQLRQRLEHRPGQALNLPGVQLREAAVLVPLFVRDGTPHALFTKRPPTMRTHGGQIAFPGGTRDPDDPTALHTALRETREELGISPAEVEVLGMLDEVPTITQFRVQPFVGVIPPGLVYRPNPEEIEEVLEVPLAQLLDPARQRTEKRLVRDVEREIYYYDWGVHVIWGATARILRSLFQIAEGIPDFQRLKPA